MADSQLLDEIKPPPPTDTEVEAVKTSVEEDEDEGSRGADSSLSLDRSATPTDAPLSSPPPLKPNSSSSSSAAAANGSDNNLTTATANAIAQTSMTTLTKTTEQDPTTSLLPTSPPQIYLNLLILEASLRAQYLSLRSRRRQHIFFLLLLTLWLLSSIYAVFLREREDGTGARGGSVYWVLDTLFKVALLGGLVTAVLIWGTGVWERGVRWPRRWVGVTNRGLRVCNLKIVVLRGKWWVRVLETLGLVFPLTALLGKGKAGGSEFCALDLGDKEVKGVLDAYSSDSLTASSGKGSGSGSGSFQYREGHRRGNYREEDLAPGGDVIKLLLLPKHFSPEFRENWETYRSEYWERENERRGELRRIVRRRQREEAKATGGMFWWIGLKTARRRDTLHSLDHKQSHGGSSDVEKSGAHSHRASKDSRSKRASGGLLLDGSNGISHSRSSSRSSNNAGSDLDDIRGRGRGSSRARRSRTSSNLGGAAGGVGIGGGRATRSSNAGSVVINPLTTSTPHAPSARRTEVTTSDLVAATPTVGVNVNVKNEDEDDAEQDLTPTVTRSTSRTDMPAPSLHKRASTLSNASSSSNESSFSERSTTSSHIGFNASAAAGGSLRIPQTRRRSRNRRESNSEAGEA